MERDYGLLVNPPVQLQRSYFEEMCKLLGVRVKYQYPVTKHYNINGELEAQYSEPEKVDCIFEQTINQKTTKKLGWLPEVSKEKPVIHVPYDLHDLQVGCLFEIPSAFENAPGRKFRVVSMAGVMIYPASITCELALEIEDAMDRSETELFNNTDFNLLSTEDDRNVAFY